MNYFKNNKIAIVGSGYWGNNIAKTLISLKVKNIFIFDNNLASLKAIKKRFSQINVVKDFNLILKDKNIDIVFVCTPTSKHFFYGKKLLQAKKNVFIEKPMSANTKMIKELIEISDKQKLKLMGGYIYIYNDYIDYIKKVLLKKNLGKIKYIEFNRKNYGPVRKDVSSLWDLASHDISILKYLFNKNISKKAINVNYNNLLNKKISDLCSLNFKIHPIHVSINVSWIHPEKVREILIIGEKKILYFDELNQINPVKIYKFNKKYPTTNFFSSKDLAPQKKILIKKPFCPKFKKVSPLKKEIETFIKSVRNNLKIKTDGNFSLDVAKDISIFSKKFS